MASLISKIFIFIVSFYCMLNASSLESRYPSYSYVFSEFDVDDDYLYNDEFIDFVKANESKLKRFYRHSLRRGKSLLPIMQGKLLEDSVSDLFIYLSMVESGFLTNAISPKKAAGLWQFMPNTAKQYNLEKYNNYDERYDTVSATKAAIKYLDKLHKQFGKWYLAAMAYNCGEGRLTKAIKKAGSSELSVLSSNQYKYLPKETRDYIKKILLLAMIGESSNIDFDSTSEYIQVKVDTNTSISTIAKLIDVDKKSLLKLNRAFIKGKVPKNKSFYMLTIPMEKIYAFYLRYEPPKIKQKPRKSYLLTRTVRLGDTLESIAKEYKSDIDEIIMINRLKYPYATVNSLLVVPVTLDIFKKYSN